MRVLTERDLPARIAEEPSPSRLDARRLFGSMAPLLVDELRRIEPRALLRLEPDIRPRLV